MVKFEGKRAMAQVSIRLSDEQEQRLRQSAEAHNTQFSVYLRELLELGEQIKGPSSKQQAEAHVNKLSSSEYMAISKIIATTSENLYLLRYLTGKFFKDEGRTAKQIAHEQAEKEI